MRLKIQKIQTSANAFEMSSKLKVIIAVLAIYTFAILVILVKANSYYSVWSDTAVVVVPTIEIVSPTNGILKEVNYSSGERVNNGDTLFVIDSIEIKDSISNLNGAADINSIIRINEVRDIVILSPNVADVLEQNLSAGSSVTSGQRIAVLAMQDSAYVRASFEVPIKRYLEIVKYDDIQIHFADRTINGRLIGNESTYDPITETVAIKFALSEPMNRALIPNEPVNLVVSKRASAFEALANYLSDTFASIRSGFDAGL